MMTKAGRFFKSKIVKFFLIIAGVMVILIIAVGTIFYINFIPNVPDADFPEPKSQEEAYLQDLQQLKAYAALDKSFDDESKKAKFLDYITTLEKQVAIFTPTKFELAVARAVALSDNGHSNVSPIGRSRRVNHLPIRFVRFEKGMYVVQALKEYKYLLGARVDSIASLPTDKMIDDFAPFYGGVENRSRFFAELDIHSPALIHALGYSESSSQLKLSFTLMDDSISSEVFDALPSNDIPQPYGRTLYHYLLTEEDQASWVHIREGKQPPLYLQNPTAPFDHHYLEESKTMYIKLNFNYDINGISLTGYLDEVMDEMKDLKPQNAIVDLRFNGGGTDATAKISKELPKLIGKNGKIYVITSAETFSAGIGAAATIKLHGKEQVLIVGEQVGDRLRFIANGGTPLKLPNSGISVNVWSSVEDYADGCWDWEDCFWLSPMFRTEGVGNLTPDIPVSPSFDDYLGGNDTVVETILSDINKMM